ncbi:MAG: hypothetical protein IKY21_03085, partial [Clostridia bacterium]|nr:hypothetical protein [Clostridia bacterium]
RSAIALLLVLVFFVGCTANEESISESASNETSEDTSITVSEVIEESSEVIINESSEPEAESSLEDKFAGIASFDTEFNEANVIYYDGDMVYQVTNFLYSDGLDEEHSVSNKFSAYQNAHDDDWFVVALSCKDDVIEVAEHIGAIEIEDHPFSKLYDWYKERTENPNKEEAQALYAEQYALLFPGAKYKKDPNPIGLIPKYTYVGYFTKPMLEELGNTYFKGNIPYTFLPEIGNNECWFKNMRLK